MNSMEKPSRILFERAITVRNIARKICKDAGCSCKGNCRRSRAMDIRENEMFLFDIRGNEACVQTKTLRRATLNSKGCVCDCPDAKKGNLCKHRILLAALVIEAFSKAKPKQSERQAKTPKDQPARGDNTRMLHRFLESQKHLARPQKQSNLKKSQKSPDPWETQRIKDSFELR